jgi:hypothetical protein
MPRSILTETIHVRLEAALRRELKREADKDRRTESAVARALIREGLEQRRHKKARSS